MFSPNYIIALKNRFYIINNEKILNYVNDKEYVDYNVLSRDNNNFDIDFDLDDYDDEGIPDFEYYYNKNKNLCSGYFCSFIPLIDENNNLNISKHNKKYKKNKYQISLENIIKITLQK